MEYSVQLIPAAIRQLKRLPQNDKRRIRDAIDGLASDPRPSSAKKLVHTKDQWRVRVGNYRIVYEIHDDRLWVLVIRIAHRKDVYRGD